MARRPVAVACSALFVACLVAPRPALALDPARQLAQYARTHYETRDGMPHGLASSLALAPDGYLWLGSEQGLARFDGATFAVTDRSHAVGLTSNGVSALAFDARGRLWVGTRDRGVVVRDGDLFQPLASVPGSGLDASTLQVRSLAVARDGTLWIGTLGHGVVRVRERAIAGVIRAADGLPSDDVRDVVEARDGTIWIATFGGLARVRAGRVEPGPLAGVAVFAIAQDAAGDVWCATARGLVRLRGDAVEPVATEVLGDTPLRRLLFDRAGNLWIGTERGLWRRTPSGELAPLLGLEATIAGLLEDPAGTLWVASELGLDRLRDGDVLPLGAAEGVTDDAVFGVREDASGAVWATTAVGVFRIPPGGGTPTWIADDRGTVYAIHERSPDDVWFGARDGSVGRWYQGAFAWLERGPWEKVRAITEAGGAMWLGTDHGLYRVDGDHLAEATLVVPHTIVSTIAVDARGDLWLGTEGQGILRVRAGAPIALPPGGPPLGSSITSLHFDPDGTLWAATEGDGLWRLRGATWRVVTSKDGLFDDLVWRMLDDGAGRVWMSSNRGIWSVERAALEARLDGAGPPLVSMVYGVADGMRDRECDGAIEPAGWRARDGRLWFPTAKGLAVIDPGGLRAPPVLAAHVERLRVDTADTPLAPDLVLPVDAARLELAFSAPAIGGAERLRFRYKLEGFDAAWNDAGLARSAQYTNLAHGTYRFVVEADAGGGWGPAGSVAFAIPPHFYQTWWFAFLAIATAVLAVLAVPWLRVRQLRARAKELDAKVQEAVRELKVLTGLLPICAWCKNIRDDKGYWNKLEAYLGARTHAEFTHGICPDCEHKLDDEDAPPVA